VRSHEVDEMTTQNKNLKLNHLFCQTFKIYTFQTFSLHPQKYDHSFFLSATGLIFERNCDSGKKRLFLYFISGCVSFPVAATWIKVAAIWRHSISFETLLISPT